jgi:hypothetical protein
MDQHALEHETLSSQDAGATPGLECFRGCRDRLLEFCRSCLWDLSD